MYNSAVVNQQVVGQILNYDPKCYLSSANDRARLQRLLEALARDEEAYSTSADGTEAYLKILSVDNCLEVLDTLFYALIYDRYGSQAKDYIASLSSLERMELRDRLYREYTAEAETLKAKAAAAFAQTFKDFSAELLLALDRTARAVIIQRRESVVPELLSEDYTEQEMQELDLQFYGMTLEDEDSLDNLDWGLEDCTYDTLEFCASEFSDDVLRREVERNGQHLILALGLSGSGWSERGTTLLQDLIRHKWKIEPDENIDHLLLEEHVSRRVTDLTVSTMKPDIAGMWGRCGSRERMNYVTTRKNAPTIAGLTVCLDFSEMEQDPALRDVVRSLTEFDRRVFWAATTLQTVQKSVSAGDIHRAMGYESRMSGAQRSDITRSMDKMMRTCVSVENPSEIAAGLKYAVITTGGHVIEAQRGLEICHGKETVVWLFTAVSALLKIATERRQIASIPVAALNPPMRRIDTGLAIENYLLDMLNITDPGAVRTLSEESILKRCGLENAHGTKRRRVLDYAERFAGHLKNVGFIKSAERKDGKLVMRKKGIPKPGRRPRKKPT